MNAIKRLAAKALDEYKEVVYNTYLWVG